LLRVSVPKTNIKETLNPKTCNPMNSKPYLKIVGNRKTRQYHIVAHPLSKHATVSQKTLSEAKYRLRYMSGYVGLLPVMVRKN
jgi:hypothetical protein